MTINKAKLKALAEAASEGRWSQNTFEVISDGIEDRRVARCSWLTDAQFIAAANPATVLELLAEIERLTPFEEAYGVACNVRNRLIQESEAACALLKRFVEGEHNQDEDQNERHHYHGEAEALLAKLGGEFKDYALIPEQALYAEAQRKSNLIAERDQLKAENEALRKDAERYRWLRNHADAADWEFLGHQCPESTDQNIDCALTPSGKGEQP